MQGAGGSSQVVSTAPKPGDEGKVLSGRSVQNPVDSSSVHLKSSLGGSQEHMIKRKRPSKDGVVEGHRWCEGSTVDTERESLDRPCRVGESSGRIKEAILDEVGGFDRGSDRLGQRLGPGLLLRGARGRSV